MIPQIIHYCWFGGQDLPSYARQNIETWSKLLPHARIQRWDEHNAPMQDIFIEICLEQKKWAFASDWTRLWALENYGGIYLDLDVEGVQNMEALLANQAIIGWESDYCVGSAILASESQFPLWKAARKKMLELLAREHRFETLSKILMQLLSDNSNCHYKNEIWTDQIGMTHYPIPYFYPFHHTEKFTPECIRPQTLAIHHWEKSWIQK